MRNYQICPSSTVFVLYSIHYVPFPLFFLINGFCVFFRLSNNNFFSPPTTCFLSFIKERLYFFFLIKSERWFLCLIKSQMMASSVIVI